MFPGFSHRCTSSAEKHQHASFIGSGWQQKNRDSFFENPMQPILLLLFQDDLIVNATKLNRRTIVVLHGGGCFNVQAWVNKVSALLHAWFPGQYGGQPLAEILFGEVNPSGKLPITIEKRVEDNPAFASFPIDDPDALEMEYSEGLFVAIGATRKTASSRNILSATDCRIRNSVTRILKSIRPPFGETMTLFA